MKKIGYIALGGMLVLGIASCNDKTKETTTTSIEIEAPQGEEEKLPEDVIPSKVDTTYKPIIKDTLPEIRIVSETNSNDFVTKPVSFAVKETKKGWIKDLNSPELTAPDPYYEKCSITVKDSTISFELSDIKADVKVRGNWTTDYEKKPLRIKFNEKQSMLGLNNGCKAKSWVLLAEYKDWSLLRDSVGLYMAKLISNTYSSDFELVDVYVNNEYFGVYLLAEQQQVHKNRIEIASPKDDYMGTDIGYLLEYDGYAKYEDHSINLDYKHPLMDINGKATNHFEAGYTIKSDITSDSQKSFIEGYMNNLWDICYSAVYNKDYKEFDSSYNVVKSNKKTAYECVSSAIDIQSLVDTYILQDIVCDPDLYWSSFYMDIDLSDSGDKRLRFEAPWDFDSSLGNKYNLSNAQGAYAGVVGQDVNHSYDCANPWMLLFCRCGWFQELVSQKWESLKTQKAFDSVYSYIEEVEQKNASKLESNFAAWPNTRLHSGVLNELCSEAKACKTQKESAMYLEAWLKARITYLDTLYLK